MSRYTAYSIDIALDSLSGLTDDQVEIILMLVSKFRQQNGE